MVSPPMDPASPPSELALVPGTTAPDAGRSGTSSPPLESPLPYRPPNPPWLYTKGILKVVWLFFLLVYIPYELLQMVKGDAILRLPLPSDTLLLVGALVAILGGAKTVTKPTRIFGPVCLALSSVKIAYLVILATDAIVGISFGTGQSGHISLGIGFVNVILLILIGSFLAAAAAFVTTVEDFKHPGERLPFDYPVK